MTDLGQFNVSAPSSNDTSEDSELTVNIKMLNVLFDDQVCSLVYMTDLTKVIREGEQKQTQESLLKASNWIYQEM